MDCRWCGPVVTDCQLFLLKKERGFGLSEVVEGSVLRDSPGMSTARPTVNGLNPFAFMG